MDSQAAILQIDLQKDELITFGQAGQLLPIKPSPATWWRWRTKGVNGIKLPALRCGNRWVTTREAVHQFLRLQTIAKAAQAKTEHELRSPEITRNLKAAGLLEKVASDVAWHIEGQVVVQPP